VGYRRQIQSLCLLLLILFSQLNHPNLLKLYGLTISPFQLVMEFAPYGDLQRILSNRKEFPDSKLSWKLRYRIALDIVNGISYLHSKMLIHRDIRSPNIFVSIAFVKYTKSYIDHVTG
jgi:serine/threonine protein kinase